jgi:L-asparaginase/Glu-tRNA(Gln) amidotransferase subunit D
VKHAGLLLVLLAARALGANVIALGGTVAMHSAAGVRGGAVDSSQLTLPDVLKAASLVSRALDQGGVPILTHGTDSLDTTGLILSQLFSHRFLVLTGAFLPPDAPGSDAPVNLADADLLAQERDRPGVPQVPYAVMNGRVHLAASLAKLDVEFRNGRRGFSSFAGPVAQIENGRVVWDKNFLADFEQRRRPASPPPALGRAEIAYVNSHTPRAYIRAVLARLKSGMSAAVVFHGLFPTSALLETDIRRLRLSGKPVYVQAFEGLGIRSALFPAGLEPFQLLYKLAVLLPETSRLPALDRQLKRNFAGEISRAPNPALSLPVELGNFYRDGNISRGFLLYHQDLGLMRAALVSELERLREEQSRGRTAELIIEGLGNGHIHLDLRGLLAQAKRDGISVTITTRVHDAVPDASYEVGRKLTAPTVGARLSLFAGRKALTRLTR